MEVRREPVEPHFYDQRAQAVLDAGGEIEYNEYGMPRSVHLCATCGGRFTVCPPSTTFGDDCLAVECDSYDPGRDAEVLFAPSDPDLIENGSSE